ncbi:hypothetical protein BpHYR1_009286 [Brachionus plicatilis]|uniref:Uncharacterized protein n=1 Tax=Brachionus plicatilis TaxID=10195 RepID=A0A3M7T2D1_BRAPC|nr:hypothetical protein BpHYR1_009286 [Brachionus plicatilis]
MHAVQKTAREGQVYLNTFVIRIILMDELLDTIRSRLVQNFSPSCQNKQNYLIENFQVPQFN